MRVVVVALLLGFISGCASESWVRRQQPTNIPFAASDANGMLVAAENIGTSVEPGIIRFVRVDLAARRALETVDIEAGSVRGPIMFSGKPGSTISHAFHYATVPPGDYALVYRDSRGTNVVTNFTDWGCLSDAAPVFSVRAGEIAVVRAPNRSVYDFIFDTPQLRERVAREGGSRASYYSNEKLARDFEEIVEVNTFLTAPHHIAAPIATIAFPARDRPGRDECVPRDALAVTMR